MVAENNFTQEELDAIVALLKSTTHVTELQVTWGEAQFRLSRNAEDVQVEGGMMTAAGQTVAAPPSQAILAAAPKDDRQSAVTPDTVVLRSQTVGTFYRAAAPGEKPFIEIGASVRPDSTIGNIKIIRRTKAVPAGVAGRVSALLVVDGQPIEFGQPLATIQRMSEPK